jgi:hypothetical protein
VYLSQLCDALGAAVRSQPTEIRSEVDVVARYEDLFLFSFPNTDSAEVMVPMRRIIDIARDSARKAMGDETFLLPISCGMLTWEHISGPIQPADFVYRTIEALYQAKKEAANRLTLLRLGMKDESTDRLRIKHSQTAPLRLRNQPAGIAGLLGPAESAGANAASGDRRKRKKKKTKSDGAATKKKKKGPFWKFW